MTRNAPRKLKVTSDASSGSEAMIVGGIPAECATWNAKKSEGYIVVNDRRHITKVLTRRRRRGVGVGGKDEA